MADQVVLVEKTQGVAILTLNRPEQLNAMNAQLGAELRLAVERMSADDEVGCIVVTGAGDRAFSAGGDIHEQREDDRKYTQAELDARAAVRALTASKIRELYNEGIGRADILLNNLFSNACNHNMADGSVIIQLTQGRFAISNTGSPVPLNEKRLFSRFYKETINSSSNGLGLSIVKQVCDLAGYKLTYRYENEQHVFSIRF